MGRQKILLIEDDSFIVETIENCLAPTYLLTSIRNGREGLAAAITEKPDLIILGTSLPELDGFQVCEKIREQPALAILPVLMITANSGEEERMVGFKAGCDEILGRPFSIEELSMRVKALLRRARRRPTVPTERKAATMSTALQRSHFEEREDHQEKILVLGGYVLNTSSYELVTPHRGKVPLTPVQFRLLLHLMSHPYEIFTPQQLLERVWGYPTQSGTADLVRVHIKKLRDRIEKDPQEPRFLRTVSGSGYMVFPGKD